MADLAVDLAGAERLARTLDAAGGDLADLQQVNQAAGDQVIGAATIPRRTGALDATARAEADAIGFALVAGSEAVDYAGTVHAREPFFTDALAAQEAAVVDRYTDHVGAALDQIQGA